MQTKAKKARNVKAAARVTELPAPPAEIILPESTDTPAAIVYKSATRDAATVAAQATNFALESNRDSAYLIFFGSVMRANGNNDSATLAQIHAAGKPGAKPGQRLNPHYSGSAKATDAGAINRAIKAGYLTQSESGNRLTATDKAKASALYNKISV